MLRAALWPRESHTALQKRDQSHWESSSVNRGFGVGATVSGSEAGARRGRGDRERISRDSDLVYAGKWMWGIPGRWRSRGRGTVTMRMTLKFGIYVRQRSPYRGRWWHY